MFHMRGSQNELKLSNSGEKEPSSEVISANVGFIYIKSGLLTIQALCQCIFANV